MTEEIEKNRGKGKMRIGFEIKIIISPLSDA